MGKIFNICKNPVSTITSCFEQIEIKAPVVRIKRPNWKVRENALECDKFESKKIVKNSNPVIRMRNGIGKLMSHFQHPNNK